MKADIRWTLFVPVGLVVFGAVLMLMGAGRGLDKVSGSNDFWSGVADITEFVLFSSMSGWSIAFVVCLAALLVLFDKHADANLAGKRGAKLLFLTGFVVSIGITFFVFFQMTSTGFSLTTLIAFGIPIIIATLAATRKRTVSSTS